MRRALRAAGVADVGVVVTGMGLEAARVAAQACVPQAGAVVVCGLAGALGSELQVGDVVVATGLVDASGNHIGPVALRGVAGARRGVVASVASPVDGAGERAALRAHGAIAVETEAAGWVPVCASHGAALLVVRAVVDTPAEPLGPAARLIPPGGSRPSWARLAAVAVQPWAWAGLLRLARVAARAERSAARAAVAVARDLKQVGAADRSATPAPGTERPAGA